MKPLTEWIDNVALGALTSRESVRASYDLARMVIENGVPGDFVEAGVYGGAQCAAMARAIIDAHDDWLDDGLAKSLEPAPRRVHLFDTFAGIPQAGPEDTEFLTVGHEPGLSTCSLEAVKQHMAQWGIPDELLVYHEGDFADTVPAWAGVTHSREITHPDDCACGTCAPGHRLVISWPWSQQIALLRLDGDLYRSTKVCLEHLYPLVSVGGWTVIDDFGLSGARKAVMEMVNATNGYMPAYFQKQPPI